VPKSRNVGKTRHAIHRGNYILSQNAVKAKPACKASFVAGYCRGPKSRVAAFHRPPRLKNQCSYFKVGLKQLLLGGASNLHIVNATILPVRVGCR
jgi:hypothetical protein